jgi:acyl carrier protein
MNPKKLEIKKKQKIRRIISDHLGISLNELTENADLRDDLNAEELEIADLLAKLEEVFATNLSPEDAIRFKTVGDITDFL